jgi:hypothetical protein
MSDSHSRIAALVAQRRRKATAPERRPAVSGRWGLATDGQPIDADKRSVVNEQKMLTKRAAVASENLEKAKRRLATLERRVTGSATLEGGICGLPPHLARSTPVAASEVTP